MNDAPLKRFPSAVDKETSGTGEDSLGVSCDLQESTKFFFDEYRTVLRVDILISWPMVKYSRTIPKWIYQTGVVREVFGAVERYYCQLVVIFSQHPVIWK